MHLLLHSVLRGKLIEMMLRRTKSPNTKKKLHFKKHYNISLHSETQVGEGGLRFVNIKSLYKCCRGMVLDWNSKIIKLDTHTQNKMHVFSDTVRWSA